MVAGPIGPGLPEPGSATTVRGTGGGEKPQPSWCGGRGPLTHSLSGEGARQTFPGVGPLGPGQELNHTPEWPLLSLAGGQGTFQGPMGSPSSDT